MNTAQEEIELSGYEAYSHEEASYDREHDRFYNMRRHEAINEIIRLQGELWKIEQSLNLPFGERVRLEKGWTSRDRNTIANLGAEVFLAHHKRGIELRMMEAAYGNTDDVRKEIEVLSNECTAFCREAKVNNAFFFPKGFRYMNSYELQSVLARAKQARDTMHLLVLERAAEAKRKEREAEIRAAHEQELKRIDAERNARRDERKAELEGIVSGYTEMVTKILEHPVFRSASIKLPKLQLDRYMIEFKLGTLGDEGYQLLVRKTRDGIADAKRKLREPLRRAHQSAHSRGITKLSFEECLKEGGFESLLA
jgi:hypothetical protein